MPLFSAIGNRSFRNTIRRIVTVSVDKTTVNEGDTITWTVNTQNVAAGSGFFYRLAGTGGFNSPTGFNQADLLEGLILGSVIVNSSGIGTMTIRLANDLSYLEGPEIVRMEIREFADINSNILAASPYTTINDTSRVERGEFSTGGFGTGTPAAVNWFVPAGVTSISVLCIGGGGSGSSGTSGRVANQTRYYGGAGGGGGGVAYVNDIAVTPGQRWTYGVGGAGGTTYLFDPTLNRFACSAGSGGNASMATTSLNAQGGLGGGSGPDSTYARAGFGGGAGGRGGSSYWDLSYSDGAGGGGAAGYTGNGGRGSDGHLATNWGSGSGGGGAGGFRMQGGGGVGGFGASSGGTSAGQGGSGGSNGVDRGRGGGYGGGGSGGSGGRFGATAGTLGGVGYIRIVWPGNFRTFPNLSNS